MASQNRWIIVIAALAVIPGTVAYHPATAEGASRAIASSLAAESAPAKRESVATGKLSSDLKTGASTVRKVLASGSEGLVQRPSGVKEGIARERLSGSDKSGLVLPVRAPKTGRPGTIAAGKTKRASGNPTVTDEGDPRVELSATQYEVYGAVDEWSPGQDFDGDGYYETFDFLVGIDADANPDAATVYGRIICETTGQSWWSAAPWTVQGDDYDFKWFSFAESDFEGHLSGDTTLDFTVEIYDDTRSNLLAADAVVEGEEDLKVEADINGYSVCAEVADWTPGADTDNDNYYETFSFRIGVSGDVGPGSAMVTAKVICATTGQQWWLPATWQVEGDTEDYYFLELNQDSFAGRIEGQSVLDFSVELWDAERQKALAATDEVSDEARVLVEPAGQGGPYLSLSTDSVLFSNQEDPVPTANTGEAAGQDLESATTPGEVRHEVRFDASSLDLVETSDGLRPALAGCSLPEDDPGTPWLPASYIDLQIPAAATGLQLGIKADERLYGAGLDIAPVQPPQPRDKPPRAPRAPKDARVYASTEILPAEQARIVGRQFVQGFQVVTVRINPLRYRPATGELFITERIVVALSFQEGPTSIRLQSLIRKGANFVGRLVVNPETLERNAPLAKRQSPDSPIDYLIVTDALLLEAFQELADHRSGFNGLNTEVLAIAAIDAAYPGTDTQERIRNCIIDYYQNRGLTYVVLGGDDTVVPDRDCSVSVAGEYEEAMPTDLYYAGLDGDWDADGDGIYGEASTAQGDEADMGPEVMVGRIPVQTASDAQGYVDKLIAYEAGGDSGRAAFFIGGAESWDVYTGDDRPSDTVNDGHLAFKATDHPDVSDSEMWGRRLYRDGISPFTTVGRLGYYFDTLTSLDSVTAGDNPQTPAGMLDFLNQGWGNLFFCTHGDVGCWSLENSVFSSTAAMQLTGLTAYVYTDACLTGAFDDSFDPCLSEAFLRNATGGAVAYMGCSRYGWGYADDPPADPDSNGGPSTMYAYEFYQRWLPGGDESLGSAFALHKAAMAGRSTAATAFRWIQFGLNLQGDPAIGLPAGASALVRMTNIGSARLTVSAIDIDVEWLSVNAATPIVLDPGDDRNIVLTVDWALVPEGTSATKVAFVSDAADSPAILSVTAIKPTALTVIRILSGHAGAGGGAPVDADGDGRTTIADAVLLLQQAAELR